MNGPGSIEAVIAAIREDVRAETERIEREAAAAVERLQQEDAALPVVIPDADRRLAVARLRGRERLAAEDWDECQRALKAREAWTSQVVEAAMRRIAAASERERRQRLLAFAREAAGTLIGGDCTLLVAPGDRSLISDAARAELETATRKRLTVEISEAVKSGCVAQTRDGRIRFDNTYEARIRRYDAAWRRIISELFDRAGPIHV